MAIFILFFVYQYLIFYQQLDMTVKDRFVCDVLHYACKLRTFKLAE